LAEKFGIVAGLYDHTLGTTVAVTSIALGACTIEKHVTLSHNDGGPDSEFSLELSHLCISVKNAWLALGKVKHGMVQAEESSIKFRRSVYAVKDIRAGEMLTHENICCIRPGYGLLPKYFDQVLGSIVRYSAV